MPMTEKIIALALFTGVAALYTIEAYFILAFVFNRARKTRPKYRLFTAHKSIFHLVALCGLVILIYAYFVEPYRIQVTFVDIPTPKLNGADLRIVQFSDLHCDRKTYCEEKLVELNNKLAPDIIIYTGDCINTPEALGRFQQTLRNLNAALGKFAIYGNCDLAHWKNLDLFGNTGFRVLGKETTIMKKNGQSIYISALPTKYPGEDYETFKNLPPDHFSIFLHHCPELIEDVRLLNVDLYLCGHTHAGQIKIPFYGAPLIFTEFGKKYEAGEYRLAKTILYVNRGLGMAGGWTPRLRFLCRPEITVFDITPAE